MVDFDEVAAKGVNLKASFKRVLLVSSLISTMAGQIIEKASTYIRHSEHYDQVKAGQMTRKIDGLYSMDSKQTVMVSKKETKIDGERIFMA